MPYAQYSHLASKTFCVQLWRETEPKGLILQPSEDATWTPPLLSNIEKSLMEIATNHFSESHSFMINRCTLYLLVISLNDLLLFDRPSIHPSYIDRCRPPSRVSKINWLCFPNPPKNYWIVWKRFLFQYAQPLIPQDSSWYVSSQTSFLFPFYKHISLHNLFKLEDGELTEFKLRASSRQKKRP
jgi:hypothetical protein